MKAEIDGNGKLSVVPETEMESFALRMWWENYNSGEDHERFAILEICRIEITP